MFQYALLKIEMVYDIMVWRLGSSFLFLQNNQQDRVIKKKIKCLRSNLYKKPNHSKKPQTLKKTKQKTTL